MIVSVVGIIFFDMCLMCEIIEFVCDIEFELLFYYLSCVFYFVVLVGWWCGFEYDFELFYCGCMFYDMGFMYWYSSVCECFEVDGVNVVCDFLKGNGIL